MPWSKSHLPPAAKSLKGHDVEVFVAVANSTLKQTGDDGKAVKAGLAAVKKLHTKGTMTTTKVDKSLDIKINDKEVIDSALFGTIVNAIASFFRNKKWEQEYIDENEDEVEAALGLKEDDTDEPVPVIKSLNPDLRQATYVVLEPDVVDLHQDTYSSEDVSKACHNFWAFCQKAYLDHSAETESATIVENYIAPVDMKIGEKLVHKGTWLQVWQFDDALWASVKDGTYTGVSIGAYAKTEEL